MDCQSEKEGHIKIYPLLLTIIISVFFPYGCYGSDAKSSVKPEKVTMVEQAEEASVDKQKMVSKYCESEVDKQICNTVFKARGLYYQIANHEPQGSYVRNNSMRILAQSIEINKQNTIDEFGHSDSLNIYTAFFNFVTLNEKAENLRLSQDFEEAELNRKMANESHNKIMDYCKTCIEGLK